MSNNSWNSNICVKLCSRYSWLPLCLITSLINQSIYLCCFFKRISGYTQREWILCTDINKNKSRWKSIDTYIYIFMHTLSHLRCILDYFICWRKILLSILSAKEHHFLIMSPVADFYHNDYREEKGHAIT